MCNLVPTFLSHNELTTLSLPGTLLTETSLPLKDILSLVKRRHELCSWEHPPMTDEDNKARDCLLEAIALVKDLPSAEE
jgi:hypothetical protein